MLTSNTAHSQEHTMIWYFGNQSGLDFTSGEPQVLINNAFKAEAGCTSICDENGSILFYTNGNKVWNKDHQVMANGDNLNGSQLLNQNSVIVPKPLCDSIYYLFTISNRDTTRGFNYSIVNMNMDNGFGKIVEKNIVISKDNLEKVTAAEHCNGKNYWIIVHNSANMFYCYLLNDSGFIDTIISQVGNSVGADIGYLKASPAANKIVLPVNDDDILAEVFDFDSRTGIISNPVRITTKVNNTYCYGVEFSPDGNMLYISTGGKSYDLLQYDLRIQDEEQFNASSVNIANGNNFAMQLAPNGKIYIACENRPYLNAINTPNELGEECLYQAEAIMFSQSTSLMGLPNFVQSWLYIPSFNFENTCYLDSTLFTFNQFKNTDSLIWNFGDALNNSSSSTDEHTVFHQYVDTGVYNVELEVFHCGISDNTDEQVEIFPYPVSSLIADTVICNNCFVELDAGYGFDSYQWSNGMDTRFITIYQPGEYVVEVGKNECYTYDTANINSIDVAFVMPTAFTPNGDGLNDEFKVVVTASVIDFHMWIQNRHGEIVYESDNVYNGWDGSFNGRVCNRETFVWFINYSYYSDKGLLVDTVKKGTVTLLR